MPKDRQKVKLLTVLKVFERETDENHPLSADRIAELVGTYSHIHANRKGVYDDISAINDFYYTTSKDDNCPQVELKHGRGEGKGYYLANRPFSTSDVKLMVDAIESSKYLTLPNT